MSGGIAHNRLLAKLASGLHKPDDQVRLFCVVGWLLLLTILGEVVVCVGLMSIGG